MRCVLPPELSFEALADLLTRDGWHRDPIPGLLPPLRANEPEQARFSRQNKALLYSFNPVIDLRILDGDIHSDLPRINTSDVTAWLADDDPLAQARGCLAAAELQLTHLRDAVAEAAADLPEPLHPMGQAALRRLTPLPKGRATGPFEVLTASIKRQVLRHAMADHPASVADLLPYCWADGPELAATAMIAAARLNAKDQGLAVKRSDLTPLARGRTEQEVFTALQRACLATLSGERPAGTDTPKNRFWRAVLRDTTPEDDVTLILHALTTPLPEVDLPEPPEGFCTLPKIPHWLGHAAGKGLHNPLRRWTPDAPVTAMLSAGTSVRSDGIDTALAQVMPGRHLRLLTTDEWEALMRGPDGRPYPWGVDPALPSVPISPWGALWSGRPEWATRDGTLVLCGSDHGGRVSFLREAAHDSTAAIRGVIPA
ncbi:hypothetical protein ACOXXX_01785 [Thalassococcus sp. BH17M4-6]|uniref:hypothetical protein n=1 Tax=Thalassococcus sp. BH17M4-6 TaxID=3413148 RepID=UPI003BDE51B3